MSQIIYPITHLPPVIDIGKQTEKGVTRIGFDVHEWLDDWPGMAFSVQPTRPGETESYFAASEMVGSVVFWLVGAVDTEKPGSGTVEVLGVTEDERKLSFMCRTAIANTNTATVAEIPEPNKPWVDRVILAADSAAKSATESEASADKAAASAKEAEESVQDFFVVTAAPKNEGVPVLYADKTQAEIREAVAAGKTCVLVYRTATTLVSVGTVCPYFGEGKYDTDEAESPSFFAGVKYDTRYSLWYQYTAYVRADGHVGVSGKAIKNPTKSKLKFTGAVNAEYDGSEAVTVEIPAGGGGSSLPPDAKPGQHLVADESGKAVWADDKHIECTLDGDKVSFSIPATDVYAIGTDLKHYDVSLVSLTSSDVYKLVAVRSTSSSSIMCEFSCTKTIGNVVYVYYKAVVVYNSGRCTLQSLYDRVVAVQPLPNYPPSDDTEYYLSVRNGTLAFVEPPEMGGGGGSDGSIPMAMAYDMDGQIEQEDVVPLPDLLEQYGDYCLFTLRVVLADVATMMALLYSVYKVDINTMTLYLSNAEGKRIQMTADGVIAYQTE